MKYDEFSNGTKIIDDKNALDELPTVLLGLGASKIMLIGNQYLHSLGYIDKIKNIIEGQGKLQVASVYLGDDFSDGESIVKDMYFVYMSNSCDAIVVCGSGRLIDSAKMLKLLIATQINDIKKFYDPETRERQVSYLPLITVPSKFGIGNETNSMAVIFDKDKGVSRNVVNDILLPDYCFIDGEILSNMDEKQIAYGVMEILARAIDGYTGKSSSSLTLENISRAYEDFVGRNSTDISEGFCRVALTNLRYKTQSLLDSPDADKYASLELTSAYLSKGTDSSGLGLIHCIAQAISDVKGVEYSRAVPKAIRVALRYNLDACKSKYSQCLLAFMGWKVYAASSKEERHYDFARYVLAFVDELSGKYLQTERLDYFSEDEKKAVLNNMAYNVNMLNNPKKFNVINFKMSL